MAVNLQRFQRTAPSNKPLPKDLQQQILDLEYGDHTCILHNATDQQVRAAVPFFQQGFEAGDHCFYVAHKHSIKEVETLFEQAGMDVQYHKDRGALSFQTARETFLEDGKFSIEKMLDFVESSIQDIREEGASGFRSAGEMSWFIDTETSPEDVIEYEARLNNIIEDRQAVLLCQYNTGNVPPDIVQKILTTHPIAVVDDLICSNPFYVPPQLLLEDTEDKQQLDWKIGQLRDHEQTQQELEVLNRKLEETLDVKQSLLQELHHRVKNNMQILTGLLGLERRRSTSQQIENVLGDCQSRISSMGLVHKYLHKSEHFAPTMELQSYVRDLVERTISSISNGDKDISVSLNAPEQTIQLDMDSIIPLGLCINELTTNAVRHGFTNPGVEYEIVIDLKLHDDDHLQLQFHDNGVGLPDGFSTDTEESLGVNLIHKLVTKQLNGEVTARSDQGAHFILTFPLPQDSNL